MSNAPGLRRLQAVGDHIRAFDVQVASPEEVADEVPCQKPRTQPQLLGSAPTSTPTRRLSLADKCRDVTRTETADP
jgi:hypothetical protein